MKKKTTTKKVKRKDIQKEDSLKELEVIDKTNYRQFMILLYEDTTSYNYDEVINKLTTYKKYAYIKHVPEIEEKKEHIHAIIVLENKTSISSISKKLGVPKQFIQSINDIRQSCRYLIHLGWEDKVQYDLDSVTVSDSFKKEFNKYFDDIETEEVIINKIILKINELKPFYKQSIDLKMELLRYVATENYSTLYKKYYQLFNEYIQSKYQSIDLRLS